MKMKLLIVTVFILCLSQFSNSKEIKILAWVNNEIITTGDIENQIIIKKKVLNKLIYDVNLGAELFKLIDKKIKYIEIENKKININSKIIERNFRAFLNKNNVNINYLQEKKYIKGIIKEEIRVQLAWKKLIQQLYGWKINVNIYEIKNKEKKINKSLNKKKQNEIKNKIFLSEKSRKFESFSNQHLAKVRKKTFIKINE